MPKNRKWGDLSKAARDRAARIADRDYDLTRNAVAKRYNRGTYNPLARDPIKRLPRELRRHADPVTGEVSWQDLAAQNIYRHLSEYAKYNDHAVIHFTSQANDKTAKIIALATEDELLQYASPQAVRQADGTFKPPPIEQWGLPGVTIEDVSVYVGGEWNNVFWYH